MKRRSKGRDNERSNIKIKEEGTKEEWRRRKRDVDKRWKQGKNDERKRERRREGRKEGMKEREEAHREREESGERRKTK